MPAAVAAVESSSSSTSASASQLASEHPGADAALSQARDMFNKLSEVHENVSALAGQLASQNSEQRSKLTRALAIVNQFSNDNTPANRQKLHHLLNLVTGSSCDAGGVTVTLGKATLFKLSL